MAGREDEAPMNEVGARNVACTGGIAMAADNAAAIVARKCTLAAHVQQWSLCK